MGVGEGNTAVYNKFSVLLQNISTDSQIKQLNIKMHKGCEEGITFEETSVSHKHEHIVPTSNLRHSDENMKEIISHFLEE